jgi:multiple sugar transport system substrate-binding protein
MKKIMSLIVFLLLAASAVFARGGGAAGPEETLTLIGGWAGPEMEQFMPVLKAFEEKENVTVKYRIYRAEDLSSLMPVQFDAGQAPGDVIAMWDWWVIENHDAAVDLSDIWAPEKDSFIAPAVEAGGKVVTVPFTMVVKPGFWYRKSFFAEHGLEAPGTWEEPSFIKA